MCPISFYFKTTASHVILIIKEFNNSQPKKVLGHQITRIRETEAFLGWERNKFNIK
jgi:hypothetical protein